MVESFLLPFPYKRGQPQVFLILVDDLGPKHVFHLFFNLHTCVFPKKKEKPSLYLASTLTIFHNPQGFL